MPDAVSPWYYTLIVLLSLVSLFYLVLVFRPRLSWELTKWRYRDPDAVEPSRLAFNLRRVRALLGFLVFGAVAVLLVAAREGIADAASALAPLLR
ncbi:hypothetical protein [Nocardiopsis composta]|uniref:Ca2+/Na+ antiporter n=1 Tax=Nocardiopsis composta TaxID=157465 RepID=A0A7W8QR91_9ACTN|nr:hypothetical protein [Nocardiopsis composta]MBB5435004.1 Ca2+/Na+ antiporter [Nocardiopsis composta]